MMRLAVVFACVAGAGCNVTFTPSSADAGPADLSRDLPRPDATVAPPDAARADATRRGWVTTLAGSSTGNVDDVPADKAKFFRPRGIAVDKAGERVYVADSGNGWVRVIRRGHVVKLKLAAKLVRPSSLTLSPDGKTLYIGDVGDLSNSGTTANRLVHVVTLTADGLGAASATVLPQPDGLTQKKRFRPEDLALDATGNVYIADHNNNVVHRYDATRKKLETWLGSGTSKGCSLAVVGTKVPGPLPRLSLPAGRPAGVDVDASGNIYISAMECNYIMRVDRAGGFRTAYRWRAPAPTVHKTAPP